MDMNKLVKSMVDRAYKTASSLTDQTIKVNYACIFSQSSTEFSDLIDQVNLSGGAVILDTKMGPVFEVEAISTKAGDLRILKIRKPDLNRKERGDADFTLTNYLKFKKENLDKLGFKLIPREDFEMIEFDPQNGSPLVYFSNPTLAETLGLSHLL